MTAPKEPETGRAPKTILAIWHVANKGKTETLRAFANLLLLTYPNHTAVSPLPLAVVPQTGDFSLVVTINGKTIAVESQGDPNTGLAKRLRNVANNFTPELLLCSTRTKGDTTSAVENVAAACGYDIIWTSTYQAGHGHRLANQTKARHMLDLLQTLSII